MLHFLELPHFRLQAQRGISRLHFKPHLLTLGCPLVKSIVMNSRRRHVYAINFQLPLYLLKIELGGKELFRVKKLASVTSRTPGGSQGARDHQHRAVEYLPPIGVHRSHQPHPCRVCTTWNYLYAPEQISHFYTCVFADHGFRFKTIIHIVFNNGAFSSHGKWASASVNEWMAFQKIWFCTTILLQLHAA